MYYKDSIKTILNQSKEDTMEALIETVKKCNGVLVVSGYSSAKEIKEKHPDIVVVHLGALEKISALTQTCPVFFDSSVIYKLCQ